MPKYQKLQPLADYGFIINQNCISCRLCSKLCPCHNIELIDGKPVFKHKCSQCMACVCYCPNRAIGYKIPADAMDLLSDNILDVSLVKNMSLPQKRIIYTNPYITAADIIKNSKKIDFK